MTPKARQAHNLRFKGLTYRKIAEEMSLSPERIYQLVNRACQEYRRQIEMLNAPPTVQENTASRLADLEGAS